jgi:hypothetical protein
MEVKLERARAMVESREVEGSETVVMAPGGMAGAVTSDVEVGEPVHFWCPYSELRSAAQPCR